MSPAAMNDTTFDYIIIGAGTAGCLLANRLSADASKRVLLIEAGRRDDYHWIHIPVGYLYCISNPRTDWMFKTEAEPGLNGRSLIYPRGKTLGGCSSINGMIYMRGQARDYDHWERCWAIRPGTGTTACLISNYTKITTAVAGRCTAPRVSARRSCRSRKAPTTSFSNIVTRVASGASTSRDFAGMCWRPFLRLRYKPAFRPAATSTLGTTTVSDISRSTRKAAGAGTPPRLSCGLRASVGPISNCGPGHRWRSC